MTLELTLRSEKYCHKLYASQMKGFGVVWDAPRYPYVIPTLLFRTFLQPFWRPLWILLSWIGRAAYNCFFDGDASPASATVTARSFATKILQQAQETFEPEFDLSMNDDEVI
jgi:hypothetical protein